MPSPSTCIVNNWENASNGLWWHDKGNNEFGHFGQKTTAHWTASTKYPVDFECFNIGGIILYIPFVSPQSGVIVIICILPFISDLIRAHHTAEAGAAPKITRHGQSMLLQ